MKTFTIMKSGLFDTLASIQIALFLAWKTWCKNGLRDEGDATKMCKFLALNAIQGTDTRAFGGPSHWYFTISSTMKPFHAIPKLSLFEMSIWKTTSVASNTSSAVTKRKD